MRMHWHGQIVRIRIEIDLNEFYSMSSAVWYSELALD